MSDLITRASARIVASSTIIFLASTGIAFAHDAKTGHSYARHASGACVPHHHPGRRCRSTSRGATDEKTAPVVARAAPCENASLTPDARHISIAETATLCLINQVRRQHDLAALSPNADLQAAAKGHNSDMVAHNYFANIGPSGDTPLSRIQDTGYLTTHAAGYIIGENIAWGTGPLATPASIVSSWIDSPAVLANILLAYTDAGTAIATPGSSVGEPPVAVYTQDYGRAATSGGYAPSSYPSSR
jgi:uncharacterized protein YkwD